MDVDVAKINQTIFQQTISGSEEDAEDKGFTESELNEIQRSLYEKLTRPQVGHIMKILRGFRDGATSTETENALVND